MPILLVRCSCRIVFLRIGDVSLLYRVLNPMVRALLRSPLHSLISHNTMLIHYRGRRSGRSFVLPVSYAREGDELIAFAGRESKWWRNLKDGPVVELRVAGRTLRARASVETRRRAMIQADLTTFLTAVPRDAMPAGVKLEADGTPNQADVEAAIEGLAAVRLRLLDALEEETR